MQIGILEPKEFSLNAIENLKKIGSVELFNGTNLDEFLIDKEVLFIRLDYYINDLMLKKAPKLKYLCSPTTGLNHIDLNVITQRNITIVCLKGEEEFLLTIRATPEHTIGLVLSLLRNYKDAFKNFAQWKRDDFKGYELYGKSVGIIGYGRVGTIMSKYFQAFDCSTYFYDISKKTAKYGAKQLDTIEDVIKKCDVIVLSAFYSEENIKFINKKYIDLMKDKFFINTARGELIDEIYLLDKIEQNFFKGVALDVIAEENSDNNLDIMAVLTQKRNFIITPHIAGATFESMSKTEEFIVKKLKKILENE